MTAKYRKIPLSLRLDEETLVLLEELSSKDGVTISALVRVAITAFLRKQLGYDQ